MSTATVLRTTVLPRTSARANALLVVGGVVFLSLMAQVAWQPKGWPVPITGQTLGVLIIGTSFGATLGVVTFALYLAAGALGAPIFSQAHHGFSVLTGPTGGYLIGMLLTAFVTGKLAERKWDTKVPSALLQMIIGEVLIFVPGVLVLAAYYSMPLSAAIENGFTKFVGVEAIKIVFAGLLMPTTWSLVKYIKRDV